MAGRFQNLWVSPPPNPPGTMPNDIPRIKHSSGYGGATDSIALQAAFDDLQVGDTLIINEEYKLTQTVNLSQHHVQIIGMGGGISADSNGNPSPLIKIMNTAASSNIHHVVISGLRFSNALGVPLGQGNGIAIEVRQEITSGTVWHVKLDNLDMQNFLYGILLDSVFDVNVENCQVSQCQAGLRVQGRANLQVPSSIRVFGGFFVNNRYHLSVDTAGQSLSFSDIHLFGWTCGHQRNGVTSGYADGVTSYHPTAQHSMFGCHFEDLAHAVHIYSDDSNAKATIGALTAVGCNFGPIHNSAISGFVNSNIKSLALMGNLYTGQATCSGTPETLFMPPFLDTTNADPVLKGCFVGGNSLEYQPPTSPLPLPMQCQLPATNPLPTRYPATGYLEFNPTQAKKAYRVSSFSTLTSNFTRPSANSVFPGPVIFNTHTNKLNVSDGTNWRDANGAIV